MTNPSVQPALDDPPASSAIQDLQRRYGAHWSVWRSSDLSVYATRHAPLTQIELDDKRPGRTLAADTADELVDKLDAEYKLVAEVAKAAGVENPLA
jgi:hypothetical protein